MPPILLRQFIKKGFIVTNLIVAVLFLLGCYAKWFDPANWWFIGLFTLASVYLFLILCVFCVFWLFVEPALSLIFIVVILLTWKPIQNIIPFRVSSSFTIKRQPNTLRIMSWNVAQFNILEDKKHPEVKKQMLALINRYQPDIACFQEMVAGDKPVDLNTPYYHKYRFYSLSSFVDSLHFPEYFYGYNYKEDFLDSQHFGILILSKYPLINRHAVMKYPYDYNSIFQYADMVKGGDTFRIFNVHLQSLKFTPVNLNYIDSPSLESRADIEKSQSVLGKMKIGFLKRKAQAELVREKIDSSPYPIILCGDFNDVPNSYAYATIGKGLQNAFVEKGSGIGRTFSGISSTLRIDNIFVDDDFSVEQFTKINKKLSDHYPVITDIQLKPETQ
ncbi:MAG TPA: endonuclease/exonuclease/phosphatase family protein [Ferruginibacter sp.]|nr:endonuclease/exonuclease/phosphatase family protein [Ferruginibacter sp.]